MNTGTTNAAPLAADAAQATAWSWLRRSRQVIALPLMFGIAVVVFTIGAPGFLTLDNLTNIARQSVYLLIISLGQLIVMIGGGLDLSVGAVVALASVTAATVMAAVFAAMPQAPGLAIVAGVAVHLLIGVATGLVNGLGVTQLRIPPFMMTLGMGSVLFGLTLLVSGGAPVYGLPRELGSIFGFGEWFGIPIPALVALLMVTLTYALLEWSRYGRHLYATGGNSRAALLSGVRTHRVVVVSFVLSSVMAALSGFLLTARLGTGEANIGASLPLDSIAACVIAGVSLSGGQGRTFKVLLGTLLIMLVQNGLNLMQIGAYAQTMVIGGILIVAMAIARH